jgi:hypothetical protein
MFGKVMDARAVITNEFLEYAICDICHGPEQNRMPDVWVRHNQLGSLLMRSKLAISALVVTSLFGATLIASAQNQPAPGHRPR